MFQSPKISCLTVTRNRPDFLRKAIDCFSRQTYPNKELVILSSSDEPEDVHGDDIQYVHLTAPKSLGAMRNLACEITTGDYICIWDDDDLSHSCRLITQFKALGSNVASAYSQHLRYFTASNRLFWVDNSKEIFHANRYLPSTLMFSRAYLRVFEGFIYNEAGDTDIVSKFLKRGKISAVMKGYQFLSVRHSQNIGHDESDIRNQTNELLTQERTLIEETIRGIYPIKE